MRLTFCLFSILAGVTAVHAQFDPVKMDEVTVSARVANQVPVGTFGMPISALRYEPQIDLQTRSLAEAQADLTIRGGTFETVGFRLGGVSLGDPQTGHYLAEIPVAPEMLTQPRVGTGASLSLDSINATSGLVSYGWRPVRRGGALSLVVGEGELLSAAGHQGLPGIARFGKGQINADFAWARSSSDGVLRYSDHEFERLNGRLQWIDGQTQTDFWAAYQTKRFGLVNLYTPFNSAETEDLQTLLVALNHRVEFLAGDYFETAISYRRNKDDYAFNRFAAVGPVHPFQHTTWLTGAAVSGRSSLGEATLVYRGEASADEIESTSLTFGNYRTRTLGKASLAAEKVWGADQGGRVVATVGVSVDDSNRTDPAWSPVVELAREWPGSGIARAWVGFAGSTQLPSYTALNSNANAGLFRGNASLGRSRAENIEAGIAGAAGKWSGSAVIFARSDRDLVDWTFRRGVTARSANAVNLDTSGLEVIARRQWSRAEVVFGFTALAKDADYKGAAVDASFYALNYARYRLTAALIWRIAREWELRLDNAARVQSDNLLRSIGGDEALMSTLGVGYRPVALPGVSFALRADNLWQSNFQEVPAVPASPRLFSLGVTYAW